jgi:hypothetical protein
VRVLAGGRGWQVLLVGALLPLCWLGMQAVHELGHVGALWASRGTVAKVVLHPLTISRTDPGVNPQPLFEVWAGPVVGVLLPLAALGVAQLVHFSGTHLLRFFAGFCLIANGCYLGVAPLDAVGDAHTLLVLGAPVWQLVLFGVVTVSPGLYGTGRGSTSGARTSGPPRRW